MSVMGKLGKEPSAGEFRWLDPKTLEHVPTGARLTHTLGEPAVASFDAGLLTTPLGDGGDYDVESVIDLAWRLMAMKSRGTD